MAVPELSKLLAELMCKREIEGAVLLELAHNFESVEQRRCTRITGSAARHITQFNLGRKKDNDDAAAATFRAGAAAPFINWISWVLRHTRQLKQPETLPQTPICVQDNRKGC